jgi:hypothetical protein
MEQHSFQIHFLYRIKIAFLGGKIKQGRVDGSKRVKGGIGAAEAAGDVHIGRNMKAVFSGGRRWTPPVR